LEKTKNKTMSTKYITIQSAKGGSEGWLEFEKGEVIELIGKQSESW
jgi:hypothetical protein